MNLLTGSACFEQIWLQKKISMGETFPPPNTQSNKKSIVWKKYYKISFVWQPLECFCFCNKIHYEKGNYMIETTAKTVDSEEHGKPSRSTSYEHLLLVFRLRYKIELLVSGWQKKNLEGVETQLPRKSEPHEKLSLWHFNKSLMSLAQSIMFSENWLIWYFTYIICVLRRFFLEIFLISLR